MIQNVIALENYPSNYLSSKWVFLGPFHRQELIGYLAIVYLQTVIIHKDVI